MTRGYSTVGLPDELKKEIDRVVTVKEYGYTSRADFVKKAVEFQLEQINKTGKNE
jgi:metal-responsive CopG/Arc/MetJ family transcriptional regulator